MPIGDMLIRSVDDAQINTVFPKTFEEYKKWDRKKDELPPEAVYRTLFEELATGEKIKIGRALTRMNYSKSGWKSLIKKTSRQIKKMIKKYFHNDLFFEKILKIMYPHARSQVWKHSIQTYFVQFGPNLCQHIGQFLLSLWTFHFPY